MLKNFWYACEIAAQLAAVPRGVRLLGRDLVLYRDAVGAVHALDNRCAHRGGCLADGRIEGDSIRCPYHGWRYGPEGACVEVPSQPPGAPIPTRARIGRYPAMERYGWVWVFIGELPENERPPLPDLPEVDSPDWRAIHGEFSWNAGWGRVIENGLDIAHAAFVHHNSFGNAEQPVVEHFEVHHEDWGAWARTRMNPGGRARRRGKRGAPLSVHMTLGFHLPNITRLELDFGGNRVILISANVPTDATRTRTLYLQLRNSFTKRWIDKGAHRRVRRIFEEDRPLVEASRPQRLPALDLEVSVPADRLGIAFRRRLEDLCARGWGADDGPVDSGATAG